jgi:hypothetical protein
MGTADAEPPEAKDARGLLRLPIDKSSLLRADYHAIKQFVTYMNTIRGSYVILNHVFRVGWLPAVFP